MAHFGDWSERVLKLGGLLAAFGYISLRQHLNYLGIANPGGLSFERYLMETWHWLASTVDLLWPFVAAITVGWGLAWFLLGRSACVRQMVARISAPVVVLIALVAFVFAALAAQKWARLQVADLVVGRLQLSHFAFLEGGTDRTLGKLEGKTFDAGALAKILGSDLADRQGLLIYLALCLASLFGYMTLRWCPVERAAHRHPWLPSIHRLSFAAFAIMTLHIPLVFARAVHSMQYPSVKVFRKENGALLAEGLLLLRSSDGLTLWRPYRLALPNEATAVAGETLIIAADQIQHFQVGPLKDIRREALLALGSPATLPP